MNDVAVNIPIVLGTLVLLSVGIYCFRVMASATMSAAIRKAAGSGIRIKGKEQLRNTSKIGAVAFDKSGTVTMGRPEITDVIAFSGFFEEEILTFAAAAEQNSGHPLGAAVCEYTQPTVITGKLRENTVRYGENETVALHSEGRGFISGRIPPAEAFEIFNGYGVSAVIGDRKVLIGTRGFLARNGVDIHANEQILASLENSGKTVMPVAINGKAAGVVAAVDSIRPDCMEAVRKLEGMGIDVYMLTGDSAGTALRVAEQAGISHVLAGVPSQDKAAEIIKLKSRYKTVAMAGGDEPALMAADISIAVTDETGNASDIADITLEDDDLNKIPVMVEISRTAMRKVRRNLFLMVACNAAGISLAASGLVHPFAVAAASVGLSISMAVSVLNRR